MKATRNVVIIAVILIALVRLIQPTGVEPFLAAVQGFVVIGALVALALIHTGKQKTTFRYNRTADNFGRED